MKDSTKHIIEQSLSLCLMGLEAIVGIIFVPLAFFILFAAIYGGPILAYLYG